MEGAPGTMRSARAEAVAAALYESRSVSAARHISVQKEAPPPLTHIVITRVYPPLFYERS